MSGVNDAAPAFAARLMERGIKVRVATKAGQFGDQAFARGSVFVLQRDNPHASDIAAKNQVLATLDAQGFAIKGLR